MGDIHYIKFGDDHIFDEKGSKFLSLRKIQWITKDTDTEDESKSRLELRKWIVKPDGTEMPNGGFGFLTENGPDELTKLMVNQGYGKTKDILSGIVKRKDFEETVKNYEKSDEDKEGYFDMRSLLSLSSEDEDKGDIKIVNF